MCQRPKRASFISTIWNFLRVLKLIQGVNALNGLLSFLRRVRCKKSRKKEMCQRPKRASFISTRTWIRRKTSMLMCVNALNGLLSFLQKGDTR